MMERRRLLAVATQIESIYYAAGVSVNRLNGNLCCWVEKSVLFSSLVTGTML